MPRTTQSSRGGRAGACGPRTSRLRRGRSRTMAGAASPATPVPEPPFLCGVVEGFYSRPWSSSQRHDLFRRLRRLGLNAYLYAPKDDHKHRAAWRTPYEPPEAAALEALIRACQAQDVRFYYGLSPGLDLGYSRPSELTALQAKLDQVRGLGCEAFALLWDDIDTSLPAGDAHAFDDLGSAHVRVTNRVFEHLGRPPFLTCPVEYCAQRAEPNVAESQYLAALGQGLDPAIGVFWTGGQVVSETIGQAEILAVGRVLGRKPVLWDNLHANDYDQPRLFLGPYSGRDPRIIPHLSGVLSNPNCEYSFNVPALFTLSAWSRCYDQDQRPNWNPVEAAALAVPHFLEETQRATAISVHAHRGASHMALDQVDVELLFHLFWLPHAHGPRGEMLLNEFKYLRDTAHVILYYRAESPASEEPEDEIESSQQEFIDAWMERASSFHNTCQRFGKICDKFTYIPNRELFFDINSYLNNMQVTLSACNRLVRWVGLDRCRRPIQGGPTLAGLSGGLVGDLQRLYPIKSNFEYPVRSLRPSGERQAHTIQPLSTKRELEALRKGFIDLFTESQGVLKSELPTGAQAFILESRFEAFLRSHSEGHPVRTLTVEYDHMLMMCLLGTRRVKSVVKDLEKAFDEASSHPKIQIPIAFPRKEDNVPWKMLHKYEAILALTSLSDLHFTKTSDNVFKLMFMMLGDVKSAALLVEKCTPITRQYLLALKFKEVHRSTQFTLMVHHHTPEPDDPMEVS